MKNFIIQKLNENEVKFDLNDIETLVKTDHNKWLEQNDLQINKNICSIIYDNLKKIKICDPAIGSGAFQLGMLNILVFVFKNYASKLIKTKYQIIS